MNLENDQRIMLCRYEDLVTDPEKILKMTYSFIGRKFPGNHIIKKVHSSALGKGSEINISPEIETLAETMQQKLMAVYNSKTNIYS